MRRIIPRIQDKNCGIFSMLCFQGNRKILCFAPKWKSKFGNGCSFLSTNAKANIKLQRKHTCNFTYGLVTSKTWLAELLSVGFSVPFNPPPLPLSSAILLITHACKLCLVLEFSPPPHTLTLFRQVFVKYKDLNKFSLLK